jgi:hypothetical protein
VLRSEHEAADAAVDVAFDDADLLQRVALLRRTVPENFHGESLALEVSGGALGAALDRLPVLVAQPLGDNGDAILAGRLRGAAAAQQQASEDRYENLPRSMINVSRAVRGSV